MKKVLITLIILTSIALAIISYPKESVVLSMIIGGRILYPEASKILQHYCFGNGDTLNVEPSYIRQSKVVVKNMKGMKIGEDKEVEFRQSDDWRLSYALNPFHIKREESKYLVYQYIRFDTTGKIYTVLNLGGFEIKIPDNIVHVFDCQPFVAICEIKTK